MSEKLTSAIGHLPEKYITMEMVLEAAREHNPALLESLPPKFLAEEVINEVFNNESDSYWWGCNLSCIPEQYRTQNICKKTLKWSMDNLPYVPTKHIDEEIAKKIINSTRLIKSLSYLPQSLWDTELVYKALKSEGAAQSSYSYRDKKSEEKLYHTQIILSFVPERLKTKDFYLGFFTNKYTSDIIELLTPKKFKDEEYYRNMAMLDLEKVPVKKITYGVMLAMLSKDSKTTPREIFQNDEVQEYFLGMLDDTLADALIARDAEKFQRLPKKFQTPGRLILAIRTVASTGHGSFSQYNYPKKLLTLKVVKEFIKCGIEAQIPEKFWNANFVHFCFEHGKKTFFWFQQMPKEFQTKEIVTAAINYSYNNLQYALKEHISKEITTEVVRDAVDDFIRGYGYINHTKHLPVGHFSEFKRKTGLSEMFMGGEVDFITLKEQRPPFAYCRLGDLSVGVYHDHDSGRKLIIVRMEKGKEPEVLLDCCIGTLHKTWLEKYIAEADPKFKKPTVNSSLKDIQGVSYYGVESMKCVDGFDVYRNTFCGICVGYCVKKDGLTCHADTISHAMNGWEQKVESEKQAEQVTPQEVTRPFEDMVVTALMLHKKYGFCELGMTAFANDYNLDYNSRYTVGELRQIVSLQGRKPSVQTYQRELRRINVIQ